MLCVLFIHLFAGRSSSSVYGNPFLYQTLCMFIFFMKHLVDPARPKTSNGNDSTTYAEPPPCPRLVYIWTCNVPSVSVYCTCVCDRNRACYWALSPACQSVRRNGLQALCLHPGVTDSSLYLCLTHFITLIPSPPVSVAQWLRTERWGKERGQEARKSNKKVPVAVEHQLNK